MYSLSQTSATKRALLTNILSYMTLLWQAATLAPTDTSKHSMEEFKSLLCEATTTIFS